MKWDEHHALEAVDRAINDIKKAAIDDGKNLQDHPAVDTQEPRAGRLHKALMRKGFVLRSYSKASGIGDCLRLTIGTREVNDRFLAAVREASR